MSDLEAVRGDTNVYEFAVVRSGEAVNLLPGTKLWFTAKINKTDADNIAIIRKDNEALGGITISVPVLNGLATLILDPTDTDSLGKETTLYFDLQMRETNGAITTLNKGKLRIYEDITRTIL